jgi:ribosome-binding protein aMBF1 (putative translation factor)
MAPRGPILPRKDKTAAQARAALENTAFQVGVLLAIKRNRWGGRQEDLAAELGCSQTDISAIQRGTPPPKPLTNAQLKQLFKTFDLQKEAQLRRFLLWWQKMADPVESQHWPAKPLGVIED